MSLVGKPKHGKFQKKISNGYKKHKFAKQQSGFKNEQQIIRKGVENTNQKFEFNISKKQKFKKFRKEKNGINEYVQQKSNEDFIQNEVNSNTSPQHKRKSEDTDESKPHKKKLCELKWKDRKFIRKQKESKGFEIGKKIKLLWEEFRNKKCEPERKSELLKQVCDLLKGRVKEFTFAHDTVRVLECVLALGTETHSSFLFEELKDDIIPLAKSKYGKFFLQKMLKHGTKNQKEAIIKAFHGKVVSLIRHKEASEVVEIAFNECANAQQRSEFVQEFYGATFKYFKSSEIHSLGEVFEKNPENKPLIIKNMKEELMKVLEKSVVKHSIVHHVLLQFILHCDPISRSEIIQSLREVVPEILHTKDGSRVSMHCVWHGTLKDRKAIVKSMKTFVTKIAMEEHGHMVLLTLFDCVDDTKLLERHIIKELLKNVLELSTNLHGKKVLIYPLNPRDPHFFHPDIINILKTGDNNEHSKKDPEVRRAELKVAIQQPLLQLIISNIKTLYMNNAFCLFTITVLKLSVGDKTEAYRSIADLAVEPYTTENKNTHLIEQKGSIFMLKQLIVQDRHEYNKDKDCNTATFSEVLVEEVPSLVFKSWMECNRGAFLLVSLLETEIPKVVERVKRDLEGCKNYLSKKEYKGAEILLQKLKQ